MRKHNRNSETTNIISQYASYMRPILFMIGDYVAIVLAQYLAYFIRLYLLPIENVFSINTIYFLLIVPVIFISFLHFGNTYTQIGTLESRIKLLLKSTIYGIVTITFLMYVGKVSDGVSRLYVGMSGLFIFLFLIAIRAFLVRLLKYSKQLQISAVIIGAGKTAEVLLPSFSGTHNSRFNIIGYFDDMPKDNIVSQKYKYLGSFADIDKVLKGKNIHTAFVTTPGLTEEPLVKLIHKVQLHVKEISYVPNIVGAPLGSVEVEDYFDERLVMLKISNNLQRRYNRLIKRIFDLTTSLLGLIVFIPVGIIISIMIYKDSPGPVLFSHKRIGKNGREFACYKFRSMVMDSQAMLEKYLAENPEAREEWEKDFKLKDDPRVTKIGAFLRKTSLDELPQIFNVIKGEMSLVGPRPIIKDEIVKYGEYINDFYLVPPGITGLWQVSGRSDTTYEERVEMDSWYVRNWSIWIDLVLLIKTVMVVLQRKGAY